MQPFGLHFPCVDNRDRRVHRSFGNKVGTMALRVAESDVCCERVDVGST